MSPNRFRGSSGGSADQPDDASSGPLSRPSRLVQASAEQLAELIREPETARGALHGTAADASAEPQDRVAAAVLLDALLDDPAAIEALDPEAARSPQALALRFAPQLRPSAARALGGPATMVLLTWAAQPSPGAPPVEAAEAAAHLGIDDDGRIYGRVSQRAVQVSEQKGLSRALMDRLRRLTDALGRADQQARRQRAQDQAAADSAGTSTGTGPAAGEETAAAAEPRGDDDRPTPPSPAAAAETDPSSPAAPREERPAATWTSADDDALASMLGRGPEDASRGPEDPRIPQELQDPTDDPAGSAASSAEPEGAGPVDGGASEQPPRGSALGFSADPAEPGRPVGFHEPGSSVARPAGADGDPKGDQESEQSIDDRPGTGPGYGPTGGRTGKEPPRSYDFRSLGEETAKPTSEAEKAEFRTTLRNWGLFALVLVLAMIIVAIII